MSENLVDTRGFEQVLSGSFPSFGGEPTFRGPEGMFLPSGADPMNPSGSAFNRDAELRAMYERAETDEERLKILDKIGVRTETDALGDLVREFNDPKFIKDRLQANLEFEKERMAQAAPYKLLFNMPNQMINIAAMELAGAGKYSQILNEGLRSMPDLKPSAIIPNRNPSNYFK